MSAAPSLVISPAMKIDDSFESFFRRTYVRLAQGALLLTGSREEAEEVAQEALARVWARWDRIRRMDSPEGYVYRTALNIVRKRAGRASRRPDSPGGDSSVADPSIAVAERDRIMRALEELPSRQREALVLVEWLDLESAHVARLLKVTPGSVRVLLHRARALMRQALGGSNG